MTLSEIINKQTYPRIFEKAFNEGKKVICMDNGGSVRLKEGEESEITKIIGQGPSEQFSLFVKEFIWHARRFKIKED